MPTPNGLAVKALAGMLRDEVVVEGDCGYRVRATAQDREIYLILVNPDDETLDVGMHFTALPGLHAKAEIRMVDEIHNNSLMNPPCTDLAVTENRGIGITDGEADLVLSLPRYGFAGCRITTD